MTVALAAGMVVSCSDDLSLEQKATLHVEKGDLVGTLYSEAPTRVAILDEMGETGYPAVWSEDDEVNVFSATRLNFNQYTLKEGAGTNQAVFQPIETDPTLLGQKDLYAITAASYQYGVSAVDANSGNVLLTAEIPSAFDWETVAAKDNAYKMPSPWWGAASFGDNGELNVAFRPLTAVLRVDLAELPEGVNSIVLVTGNSTAVGATYTVNGTEYSGTGEGLSGTFNATLNVKNSEWPALANDRHLICYDTLRVDLPEATTAGEDKVLFIPLIAQHYDNLKVIAVQEDDVMPYIWNGEILRTFSDFTARNGQTINLQQTAEIEITASSPLEISKEIADLYDGKHSLVVSVPNIDFSDDSDNTLYILNNPKSEAGQTSVTINFPEDLDDNEINIAEIQGVFTGNVPNDGAQFLRFKTGSEVVEEYPADLGVESSSWEPEVKSAAKERTVRLNFNATNSAGINITLPTSNVEMIATQKLDKVNIIASDTYNVSGYDFDATYNAVSNEQNAALKFTGIYGTVNYAGTGAVYFLEEESEIQEYLNIFGKNPKSLRITDALINTIAYPTLGTGTNHNASSSVVPTAYIFTTGSAAIKQLLENSDKIKIKAFWTSKRLTPYAVDNGYEGSEVTDANYNIETGAIYTAAQLQGMGLAEEVYAYTISPKVESIWLGGVTFPWVGAEIEDLEEVAVSDLTWAYKVGTGGKVSDAVSLDGRNVTLKNMILDIYDPNIELPGCCGTTQKVRLLKNLGLIRSIRTESTVDLFNIQLDDVLLDTHKYAIDNIGSLVGIIQAEDAVTIGGKELGATVSNFTDIRIASKGNNIGGIVGELETKGAAVTIDAVKVESVEANNSYIHGGHIQGKNNVGGLVGRVTYDGAYDDPNDEPELGSTSETTTTTTTFYKVSQIKYEAGQWVVVDDDGIQTLFNNGSTSADENAAALKNLYYLNSDGEAVKETADAPVANRVYYTDEALQNKVGKIKAYAEAATEYWCNGEKITLNVDDLYKWIGTGEAPVTKEYVNADYSAEFEAATTPLSWTANNYYTMEETEETTTTVDGGDYPTALTVSNALVNFNLATDGIIEGEQGDNVGGMIGYAVINGPTNMWKGIEVIVPTITATTTETKAKLIADMPKFGNNVGGLVGTYYNVNDSEDPVTVSNFAGKITSSKGIIAESSIAGGVLGQQKTVRFVPTTDHSDVMAVNFGNGADLTVTVGELKAENGWVGGLVGYQEMGKDGIATSANAVTVTASKMSGANCIGGLIGEQNDQAKIATGSKKVTVSIAKVALTKGISYFSSNAERNYCGTIGTLVGQKNYWLYVNSDNVAATIEGAAKLTDARKDALLFKYNVSAATTEQIQQGYKFWGDTNGYVGFAKETSMYFVKNAQQGNYQFNIYMIY